MDPPIQECLSSELVRQCQQIQRRTAPTSNVMPESPRNHIFCLELYALPELSSLEILGESDPLDSSLQCLHLGSHALTISAACPYRPALFPSMRASEPSHVPGSCALISWHCKPQLLPRSAIHRINLHEAF